VADYIVAGLRARGDCAELVDAKAIGLPMLDRMYKEYAPGLAPLPMEALAKKVRASDAFIFVTGEYNWGIQPDLKNLTEFSRRVGLATRGSRELFRRANFGCASRCPLARHLI
jgi:NAD(P)H-dependent FMN reductase